MSAVRHYHADTFYYGNDNAVSVELNRSYEPDGTGRRGPYEIVVVDNSVSSPRFPPSLAADICAAITRAAETAAKWNAEDAAAKAGPVA